MVCSKCAKLVTGTTLATPGVKKRAEVYHGSLASSSSTGSKKAYTLGQTGIGKSKLTSKSAKNPYAQYARSASDICLFSLDVQPCANLLQLMRKVQDKGLPGPQILPQREPPPDAELVAVRVVLVHWHKPRTNTASVLLQGGHVCHVRKAEQEGQIICAYGHRPQVLPKVNGPDCHYDKKQHHTIPASIPTDLGHGTHRALPLDPAPSGT